MNSKKSKLELAAYGTDNSSSYVDPTGRIKLTSKARECARLSNLALALKFHRKTTS